MMNVEEIREYCLLKENVSESFPFGEGIKTFNYEGYLLSDELSTENKLVFLR